MPSDNKVDRVSVNASLKEHTREFSKEIIRIHPNVYVAIGYGLANSIMIDAPQGLIIIDTMATKEEAASVLREFRAISSKPIKAIIYTHNHTDHIFGAEVFAESKEVEVFAHNSTVSHIERLASVVKDSITARSFRMFGIFLEPDEKENAGIGPYLGIDKHSTLGVVFPNRVFEKELKVQVAGLDIELHHAPGETDDQLFVYIPKYSLLCPGDNFYKSFPNLYTIRGTPYRDVLKWVESLDHMIKIAPQYLVPSHTRPIEGRKNILKALSDYRDAIQFVHDQTVRGLNLGWTPDQITSRLRMPSTLAASPYLTEYYGKLEWAVRAIFSGYLGWFDGNSRNVSPVGFDKRATEIVQLLGSEAKALEYVQGKLKAGEWEWALEMVDYLRVVFPKSTSVKGLKFRILQRLAQREENANARNYYLSQARELKVGRVDYFQPKPSRQMLSNFSLETIFRSLAVHLDASKARGISKRVIFEFQDVNRIFSIHVRNEVAVIMADEAIENPDIHVVLNSIVFKELLAKLRNPAMTLPAFDYKVGGLLEFTQFLLLFEPGRYQN